MEETGFVKNNPFVYAHSEGLSAIQLNSAVGDPSFQTGQTKLDIYHAQLLACMMITSLIKTFPVLQPKYERLPDELRYDIEILTMMGKATGE